MLLIPAIDLKDGRCVRLKQGNLEDETVFSEDPAEVARHWLELGAERIHLVDLNGAVTGKPQNAPTIKAIVEAVGSEVPVQLGGGIRSLETIERYLDSGISYVVIGTAAVKSPGFLHDACNAFPGQVIVGLDARDGMLTGVNIEATVRLAQAVGVPVYASGGVHGLEDIDKLLAVESEGIQGVILGRSLYEGTLDFVAALERTGAV